MKAANFEILGIGAWGPGFQDWSELGALLGDQAVEQSKQQGALKSGPKPEIIPANERRRAPLPVRLAVESSWQASQQSGLDPALLRSVFVSGIGDTQLTDYMCRALAGENKALSPTKFHNSVHNAAAGYWTISTSCMQAANSVAGFQQSVSLSLMEALLQSHTEQQAILVTFYDAPSSDVLKELLNNQQAFAASLVLLPIKELPSSKDALCQLSMVVENKPSAWPEFQATAELQQCYQDNPSAKILSLLQAVTNKRVNNKTLSMPLSAATSLVLTIS